MNNYAYFANDGNYGDATDIVLVDASTFTDTDWEYFDGLREWDRASEAYAMAYNRDHTAGGAILATDDEVAQMVETLEAVIDYLIQNAADGNIGWAEQLGDIRDVLTTRRTNTQEN